MARRLLAWLTLVCLVTTLQLTPAAMIAEDDHQPAAQEERAEQEEKKEPEKTKEPAPEKTKEPEPEKTKGPEPEKTKEPEPEKTKEPEPEKPKEPEPEKTKEPEPEKTKEPEPEKTKEPEPEKTKEPETEETKTPDVTETPAPEETETPDVMETPAPEETETPDVTETPAPEETEKPDVTETPAPEETETPDVTETPVPEETETPDVTETPAPEETETPDVTETPAPEATVTPEPSVTPDPSMTPEPTVTPEITATPKPVKELSVTVSSSTDYAFAGEDDIKFSVKIRGGVGPYTIKIRLYNLYKDSTVSRAETVQEDGGTYVFKVKPKDYGTHRVEAVVTDARGESEKDTVKVPVPVRERETIGKWRKSVKSAKLTGDWRDDIVEIARTQIGYKESARNYIIENGEKSGYTRYGAWYGADYGKWCAMFVAFCAEYAGISGKDLPRDSNVRELYFEVKDAGALEHESYEPKKGDLIFFNWKHGKQYDHVGIVESFDGKEVGTIEGNSSNRVRRRSYDHDDTEIIGYCNMSRIMEKAGVLK